MTTVVGLEAEPICPAQWMMQVEARRSGSALPGGPEVVFRQVAGPDPSGMCERASSIN